jgi:hypothetical protein
VRHEMAALVEEQRPDSVAICPAEGKTADNALIERAQVDGVVLEALNCANVPAKAKKSATIRSNFGAVKTSDFQAACNKIPVISEIAPSAKRRASVIVAISELPS